jgi:hypothetical protein
MSVAVQSPKRRYAKFAFVRETLDRRIRRMRLAEDVVDPPIQDGGGYLVRHRDLLFLNIKTAAVLSWHAREAPFGTSPHDYQVLTHNLVAALKADGITVSGCDIRLKGSAATFFSGPHKAMPKTRSALIDLYREYRSRTPDEWEIDAIVFRLEREWLTDGQFPTRRPFDSMHRLGLSPELSDLDIQISNDAIVHRCEQRLLALGQAATEVRVKHKTYNFVRKDLVEDCLPSLYRFSLRVSDNIGRHVNIAVFPSAGPPDVSADQGELSSHFRADDWLLAFAPDGDGAGG